MDGLLNFFLLAENVTGDYRDVLLSLANWAGIPLLNVNLHEGCMRDVKVTCKPKDSPSVSFS
jgi:hypothetical protein